MVPPKMPFLIKLWLVCLDEEIMTLMWMMSVSLTRAAPPPEFIMSGYFCDTGVNETNNAMMGGDQYVYPSRLWDGTNCTSSDPCCSFNRPPWFHRVLSQPTAEDIEMRVCRDEGFTNEDIAIERLELYVQ